MLDLLMVFRKPKARAYLLSRSLEAGQRKGQVSFDLVSLDAGVSFLG